MHKLSLCFFFFTFSSLSVVGGHTQKNVVHKYIKAAFFVYIEMTERT